MIFDLIEKHKGKLMLALAAIFIISLASPAAIQNLTIAKSEPWIIFANGDLNDPGDGVSNIDNTIRSDFRGQGWNIKGYIQVEERSFAADQWSLFKNQYGNNPAICVLHEDQTPVYSGPSPYYWAGFIFSENGDPGTWNGDGDRVFGNNGKNWDDSDVTLVKYEIDNNRAVIVIWSATRTDTGDLRGLQAAWRWVASHPNADRQWYIFNQAGSIIDKSTETIHFITVDNSPPVISVDSPDNIERPEGPQDTVDGIITISGKASDTLSGIATVELSVDGGEKKLAMGTTDWSFSLNTQTITDGSHVIVATATDGAGNTAEATIMVWVWNNKDVIIYDWTAPVIDPQIPPYVSGIARLKAKVTDDYGLQSVYISIDGGSFKLMIYDETNDIYYYDWDTRDVTEGKHTIQIKAIDTNDNIALSIISAEISGDGGGIDLPGSDTTVSYNLIAAVVSGGFLTILGVPMLWKKVQDLL